MSTVFVGLSPPKDSRGLGCTDPSPETLQTGESPGVLSFLSTLSESSVGFSGVTGDSTPDRGPVRSVTGRLWWTHWTHFVHLDRSFILDNPPNLLRCLLFTGRGPSTRSRDRAKGREDRGGNTPRPPLVPYVRSSNTVSTTSSLPPFPCPYTRSLVLRRR